MQKVKPAYVLVTVLVLLGMLSAIFLLQQQHFHQQLKTQQLLNQQTYIENLQIQTSTHYWQKHLTQFQTASAKCEVVDQQIFITWQGQTHTRPLLAPVA